MNTVVFYIQHLKDNNNLHLDAIFFINRRLAFSANDEKQLFIDFVIDILGHYFAPQLALPAIILSIMDLCRLSFVVDRLSAS